MGNCLVIQEKYVNVMRTDGKIMEYKSPIKVHQVLSEFSHHAIADELPVVKYLNPNAEMVAGHLYYLLPLPMAPVKKKKKKKVRFSDNVMKDEEEKEDQVVNGVVRIKFVVSKQELQSMMGQGRVSVEDIMISQLLKDESTIKIDSIERDNDKMSSRGWLPALESIPEETSS